ncbi:TIGR01244 family sulfur transferase [Fretibacter rubidus]|uniref:TIGR01244 family sulfur transferase n=1 Tax=Fretibacter rubidus TaxID=570162 RepID=UPI00352A7011
MNIKRLTESLSVSEQISHRDMSKIAEMGFKTIINNRPDREVPFQPRSKTLAAHAKNAGIAYLDLPVISGQMTPKNVEDFTTIYAQAHRPILAFCRTGTRSANLWARANPDALSPEEISRIGQQAGYTL